MSFSGHSLPDKSSSATARLQRACYHIRLERDYDEDARKQADWRCEECGKRFSSLVEAES